MPAHKQNQYAAKNKGYDGRLNVEAVKAEKEQFKAHAKTKGLTFTDWVNKSLRAVFKKESE